MIINPDRSPDYSLYYLGAIVIHLMKSNNNEIFFDDLFKAVKNELKHNIHVSFLYCTLDWLYLISAINEENGKVTLCA